MHALRRRTRLTAALLAAAALAWAVLAAAAPAQQLARYEQDNLVSDIPGAGRITDPNLVNAWGLGFGPSTPAWVADNGTDVATLYSGAIGDSPPAIVPLVVSIPGGAPTGLVFNPTTGFVVSNGLSSGAARFLFSSEAGTITGWNPTVQAQTAVTVPGAIFKGLALAATPQGTRLYATDFHAGRVDVWDSSFAPVERPGAFVDPRLPAGFAPFGIQAVGDDIVVTYAKQDDDGEDDVAGPGNGFVDVFDTEGTLVRRLVTRGRLNSPWGAASAPDGFGAASGALLIGNFGDGRINAYDPRTGAFRGSLGSRPGRPLAIDGLWALQFGNGVIGTPQTLLFTAGPDDEEHGLFGAVRAVESP